MPTGASPVSARVELAYAAVSSSTAGLEPSAEGVECSGIARIYPSWWGFTHAAMNPAGPGNWAALFEDVPVGRQSVRIEPPIGCATASVTANDLPLSAAESGAFTFMVHPDDSVTY